MKEFLSHNAIGEDFWKSLSNMASNQGSLTLLFTLWMMWFNRNQCYHDGVCYSPRKLVENVRRSCSNVAPLPNSNVVRLSPSNWIPPLALKVDISSAFMGELLAILVGMEIAKEWSLPCVILETDCLQAVQEISKKGESFAVGDCMVADIRYISCTFNKCSFVNVEREVNSLAHELAKLPNCNNSHVTYPGGLPPDLLSPAL
ncbi:hypothetical protein REPUB_Repub11eG0070400 [Reevesia pubescens]